MEAIVDQYFHADFKYKEIIDLLERCHRKNISLRTLHRLLRQQNLYRKGIQSPVSNIVPLIQKNSREVFHGLDTVQCSRGVSKIN